MLNSYLPRILHNKVMGTDPAWPSQTTRSSLMDILERKGSTAATGTIKLDFMIVANNEMMVLIVIWTLRWRIVMAHFGVGLSLRI